MSSDFGPAGGRFRYWRQGKQIWALLAAVSLGGSPVSQCRGAEKAPAPETTPRALSLAEAKRIAFQHNWDLLASKSNVDLAIAQKIVAHEFPNPTFSFNPTQI